MMRLCVTLALAAIGASACGGCGGVDTPRGAARAFERATGRSLGDEACVHQPESFPRVTVVGGFAHDRGCSYAGIFVGRTYVPPEEAAPRGLATVGFAEADGRRREELARRWVEDVDLHYRAQLLEEGGDVFARDDTPAFHPPEVTVEEGTLVLTAWVASGAGGMNPQITFEHLEYRFAEDGEVSERVTAGFEVERGL